MTMKTLSLAAFLSACTCSAQARAIAPCPRPPAAVVMYPQSGTTVPRNVAIYLFRKTNAGLVLSEKKTGRRVRFRLVTRPGAVIARMIPNKPLKPDTAYEVRGFHNPASKQRYTLAGFTTSKAVSPAAAPTLATARVEFTRSFKPRLFRGVMVSAGGRKAVLHSRPGASRPAVVELDVTFKNPQGGITRSRLYHPWQSPLYFASASACWTMLPPVPDRGQYEVKVTPWSPTGKTGRPVTLKGRIR